MKWRNAVLTKLIPTILLAGLLAGCGDDDDVKQVQQPVQQQQQQPEPQVVYVQPDQQQVQQQPQVVYEQAPQQPQTVIVQQQPQYDSTGHLIQGMVLGHLMANSGGGSSHTTVNKTVVNKTYVNKTTTAAPAPRNYYGSQSVRRTPVPAANSRSFSTPRVSNSRPLKINTSRPSYYKSRR